MPVVVACLVPAAPLLLPALTGGQVPEVAGVRSAVARALGCLTGLDRVVVVAHEVPGTLAGFGAPGAGADERAARARGGYDEPAGEPVTSWPHELALELLDAHDGAPALRHRRSYGDPAVDDLLRGPDDGVRTGLLLIADGSRTRGPRAPGGQDPRGEVVDSELAAALRLGRAPEVSDAAAVGATAGPAVELLSRLRPGSTELLHEDAPLGVCYLVAVRRPVGPGSPS